MKQTRILDNLTRKAVMSSLKMVIKVVGKKKLMLEGGGHLLIFGQSDSPLQSVFWCNSTTTKCRLSFEDYLFFGRLEKGIDRKRGLMMTMTWLITLLIILDYLLLLDNCCVAERSSLTGEV